MILSTSAQAMSQVWFEFNVHYQVLSMASETSSSKNLESLVWLPGEHLTTQSS